MGRGKSGPSTRCKISTLGVNTCSAVAGYRKLTSPRWMNVQVRLADGRVLVAGGNIRFGARAKITRSSEIYVPATGIWSRTRPLSTPREEFTANLLNSGRIFAAGGDFGTLEALDSIEEFDPPSGRWRSLSTTLSSPRYLHSTTTLNDCGLILAGGLGSSSTKIPDAELFVRP
jgi:hypothetical protein